MKSTLQSHLSPEDQYQEGDIIDEGDTDTNYTLNVTPKKTKEDEFDELFGEEKDDLPF